MHYLCCPTKYAQRVISFSVQAPLRVWGPPQLSIAATSKAAEEAFGISKPWGGPRTVVSVCLMVIIFML